MAYLRMNEGRRWEIYGGIDATPYEITSGDVIHVEVEDADGELLLTRIEFQWAPNNAGYYYSVDGYPLWSGMRAERVRS